MAGLPRLRSAGGGLRRYHGTVLDAVHVAWAGSLEPGQPSYYRIQGPDLLNEWDNTQRSANHAHSVWRDPSRDFGLDILARTTASTTDAESALQAAC